MYFYGIFILYLVQIPVVSNRDATIKRVGVLMTVIYTPPGWERKSKEEEAKADGR
jgi:hypothetical protein